MLCIRFVDVTIQSEERVCQNRISSATNTARPGSTSHPCRKTTALMRKHKHFISAKFSKHQSTWRFWRKGWICVLIHIVCVPPVFEH